MLPFGRVIKCVFQIIADAGTKYKISINFVIVSSMPSSKYRQRSFFNSTHTNLKTLCCSHTLYIAEATVVMTFFFALQGILRGTRNIICCQNATAVYIFLY